MRSLSVLLAVLTFSCAARVTGSNPSGSNPSGSNTRDLLEVRAALYPYRTTNENSRAQQSKVEAEELAAFVSDAGEAEVYAAATALVDKFIGALADQDLSMLGAAMNPRAEWLDGAHQLATSVLRRRMRSFRYDALLTGAGAYRRLSVSSAAGDTREVRVHLRPLVPKEALGETLIFQIRKRETTQAASGAAPAYEITGVFEE
jgi:hypothetical protein